MFMFIRQQKTLMFVYFIILIQFIVSLSFFISFMLFSDLHSEITKLTTTFLSGEQVDIVNQTTKKSGSLKIILFISGYEGFETMFNVHGLRFFLLTLNCLVLFPISLINFIFIQITCISCYIASFIRRDFKFNNLKRISFYGMIVFLVLFYIFIIIALSLFLSLEKYFNTNDFKIWFTANKISNPNFTNNLSIFTFLNNYIELFFNPTSKNTTNSLNQFNISISYNSLHSIWAIFFVTGIFLFLAIIFGAIYLSCLISKRSGDNFSKLSGWLRNERIDSLKEFRIHFYRSPHFWIMLILAAISMLFPSTLHSYSSTFEIIFTLIIITFYLLILIPMLIGFIDIIKMKSSSYNLLMFLMMIFSVIFLFYSQIFGCIFLEHSTFIPLKLLVFLPIILITAEIITFIFFVYSKER